MSASILAPSEHRVTASRDHMGPPSRGPDRPGDGGGVEHRDDAEAAVRLTAQIEFGERLPERRVRLPDLPAVSATRPLSISLSSAAASPQLLRLGIQRVEGGI